MPRVKAGAAPEKRQPGRVPLFAGLLALVFTALAVLHLYWAGGGRWGAAAAIPQHADGQPVFRPGPIATFVVASGLGGFAAVCLARAGWAPWPWIWPSNQSVLAAIGLIFAARTVGDFRHFGLMRRPATSDFARMDRRLYTPLCAFLALSLFALAGG